MGLSVGAKLTPGMGSLLGSSIIVASGGALTYALGQVFVKHFESNGTLLNLDGKAMRKFFKQEFASHQQCSVITANSKKEQR